MNYASTQLSGLTINRYRRCVCGALWKKLEVDKDVVFVLNGPAT